MNEKADGKRAEAQIYGVTTKCTGPFHVHLQLLNEIYGVTAKTEVVRAGKSVLLRPFTCLKYNHNHFIREDNR